jgi:hypothetical protein
MNRANRSEQGSSCRESPRRPQSVLERLLCPVFLLNQPSPRKGFFSLSRLCMRCYLELLALRPRPKPKRRTTSHSLLLYSCATSHQHTEDKSALYRENQEPWYSASSCRALPTSHLRSATPIVASSNLLNVWDMLESCKSVGHDFIVLVSCR